LLEEVNEFKTRFSNLNSEIYILYKDLTIVAYIKCRRNGSRHKNERRIPQKEMGRKTKKKWRTSYRGKHYKQQTRDREGRRRHLREARAQTGLKRRTWMGWVEFLLAYVVKIPYGRSPPNTVQ
jgi:hypothetical protein